MGRNKMKASKLIQDLARQIAEHGDLDVILRVDCYDNNHVEVPIRHVLLHGLEKTIEIYGEER